MKTLGERLRYALELRGRGMNELDRELGQGSGYTTRLVRDEKKRPDLNLLDKISQYLQVDLEWLVFGRGAPPTADAPPARPPIMRHDPAWATELEKARAGHARLQSPIDFLDRAGDAVVPGRAVTAELIVRVAELLLVTETQGVRTPVPRDDAPMSGAADNGTKPAEPTRKTRPKR